MRLNIDRKSIKFKVSLNFVIFALVLIVLLWSLQILFLNIFYQSMKETKVNSIMSQIETSYANNDFDEFCASVFDIAQGDDGFIQITYSDGTLLMSSGFHAGSLNYANSVSTINVKLMMSEQDHISFIMNNHNPSQRTLACGQVLTEKGKPQLIVYMLSPLQLTSSTSEIIKVQLLHASIIALIIALFIAVYISSRIATPIRNITTSAKKLSDGDYGTPFQGGYCSEIDDLAETLNIASEELQKSETLRRNLMANVSHDLKTPLTMIKSYAEMVRDLSGDNPDKRNQHLQVIIEEADRLNYLVSDILAISKMQSGAIAIERSAFDLCEPVKSILTSYKLIMEEAGYKVNLDCPERLMVSGDPERIKQVCSNLINNALKFCGEDKTITVTITKKAHTALCRIHDHGNGIAPDELEHIWERYYKSSGNMVRSTSGSGLGLSIVKEILSLHKADFGVNSTVGKGTTFWFELPLV